MRRKIVGEELFEEFGTSYGIPWEKIPEGTRPTPDYKVIPYGIDVYVEIKQIDADQDFHVGHGGRTIGAHVRAKIHAARKQLRPVATQGAPTILLIYNNLDPWQAFGTEPHDFLRAMYGEFTLLLDKRTHQVVDSFYGRNQALREDTNTSISAVGGLYHRRSGPAIQIYENVFAKNPLDFSLLPRCIDATRIACSYA